MIEDGASPPRVSGQDVWDREVGEDKMYGTPPRLLCPKCGNPLWLVHGQLIPRRDPDKEYFGFEPVE